ncbi:hypothetical protein A3O11_05225 [Ligilactobacillus aviarius]|uniref:hypothetical protein n=1 Tax=Ligilactobacillus aviarius TaxID=1606 RepID=UPI0007D91FE7|nr:hypothetical protein [Ligilactobacillus aviarius]OAQ03159.1 hypothetical protein A3O10_01205 [Ligilactobacillus aviarius]OAQ04604.1 hypothetical protein A3O11_05225 [Ligilactobacillus aviarius]OAS78412.1 hypothetical protein A3O18_06605 [Ligilactobacillus aviarius]PEG70828.1 hypothetical protein A3P04_04775 [Ligilactobacillus aviarius]PEG74529.1 hypothetical protein A3O82_00065 [Ligilactobacillus aviarius]
MKRNKWIVIGIVLLTILTPRVAFAKGFHDDGGGGHTEFHADEYLISVGPDLSLISHDHFYDGEGSVISYNDGIQSFGLRVKDTFNYLIPQDWHGHRSSYYHISSGIYSKNQNSALNQLIDWADNLFFLTVGLYTILADLFWNNLPDKVKDWISSILTSKDPEKNRHAIKRKW